MVGVGDLYFEEKKAQNPILGDVFALTAMICRAAQMVYEEKFIKKYNIPPMKVLGLKGLFCFIMMTLMLVGFYYLKVQFDMGQPNGVMEDAIDGIIQLGNNQKLLIAYIGEYWWHLAFTYIKTEA